MVRLVQPSVLMTEQLLYDKKDDHSAEDQQRRSERRVLRFINSEDFGYEMNESVAKERADCKTDEKACQPPDAGLGHPERDKPDERHEAHNHHAGEREESGHPPTRWIK